MNQYPSLTVVTPAYNGAEFLDSVLETVAAQDYPNLDHVVVDDGSTDGLGEKVKAHAGRLRYLRQENRGPAAARNFAIAESSSDLVTFLDIDDLWTPGHLRRMVSCLADNPDAGIAEALIRCFFTAEDGRRYLCSEPFRFCLNGCSVYRREALEQSSGFDESLRFGEDIDFGLRCWEGDILKIPVEADGLYYRRHDASMTSVKRGVVELGLVKVYKRRADRIRKGLIDLNLPKRVDLRTYLGRAPVSWDTGVRELIR